MIRRRWDSNPRYLSVSLVFKTSSLNHSDTSPYIFHFVSLSQATHLYYHLYSHLSTTFFNFFIFFYFRLPYGIFIQPQSDSDDSIFTFFLCVSHIYLYVSKYILSYIIYKYFRIFSFSFSYTGFIQLSVDASTALSGEIQLTLLFSSGHIFNFSSSVLCSRKV